MTSRPAWQRRPIATDRQARDSVSMTTANLPAPAFGSRDLPPPHNTEAEQALLGAILVNNEAWHKIADRLKPEQFADALHARIYEACGKLIARGM